MYRFLDSRVLSAAACPTCVRSGIEAGGSIMPFVDGPGDVMALLSRHVEGIHSIQSVTRGHPHAFPFLSHPDAGGACVSSTSVVTACFVGRLERQRQSSRRRTRKGARDWRLLHGPFGAARNTDDCVDCTWKSVNNALSRKGLSTAEDEGPDASLAQTTGPGQDPALKNPDEKDGTGWK